MRNIDKWDGLIDKHYPGYSARNYIWLQGEDRIEMNNGDFSTAYDHARMVYGKRVADRNDRYLPQVNSKWDLWT